MQKILVLFVLLFSSSVFADDISDFEIDGISIGDSLVDYFSKEEIKNNTKNYYKDKTYTSVEIRRSFGTTYDELGFDFKTNDKNFIISALHGIIITNNMEKCKKMKKNILKDIKKILIDTQFYLHEGNLTIDPSGKFHMNYSHFDNGDIINITCYDYSENSEYEDHLSVTLKKKHFNDFLGYAYD